MEKDENRNVLPDDVSSYKIVREGDLVINKMKAWQGSLGIAPTAGVVSPAYFVFELDMRNKAYGHRLLRSQPYVNLLAEVSDGVRIGQWDLSTVGMKRIPVLLPPSSEQIGIVRFLDIVDSSLALYVQTKTRLISLLDEFKRTFIREAVTGRYESKVPLRDSGIPWIGRVPEHWQLVRNRSLLQVKKDVVGEAFHTHKLLSLTKTGVIPRDLDNPEGKFPASFESYQSVGAGDLIFCLFDIDETPRTVGLASESGMVTGAYTVMECREPEALEFLYWFYVAMDDGKYLKPLYSGLRKVIKKTSFMAAKIPLPPPAEQREIVQRIRVKTDATNLLINRASRELSLLRDYRARLIADVVTGKVDIRSSTELLPDETQSVEADPPGLYSRVRVPDEQAVGNGVPL